MATSVRFELDANGIERKLDRVSNRVENAVAWQVRKDTAPYVPMLTGSLDNRTRVDGGKVIYPGPYSRYLYYGKLMVSPTTGSAWARKGETKVLTEKDLQYNTAAHKLAHSHWFEASKAANLEKWLRVAQKAVDNG